jgi:hypothetical protein
MKLNIIVTKLFKLIFVLEALPSPLDITYPYKNCYFGAISFVKTLWDCGLLPRGVFSVFFRQAILAKIDPESDCTA